MTKMKDLPIYIDIDLLKMPCELMDIQFMSRRGSEHDLRRGYLKTTGEVSWMSSERTIEEIVKAVESNEGCRMLGTFNKHLIANQFYIVVGNHRVLGELLQQKPSFRIDLSHRINALLVGGQSG